MDEHGLTEPRRRYARRLSPSTRALVLAAITASVLFVSVYVNVVLGIAELYTHVFYLPMILAGIWFPRLAVQLGLLFAAWHFGINYLLTGAIVPGTLFRGAIFCLVGYTIGALSLRRELTLEGLVTAENSLRTLKDELEDRVARRTERLEALNRELDAFTYSVSHDLRTPLFTIEGYSQVLMDSESDRLGHESSFAIDRIQRAGRRMNTLIDDLLKLSRVGQSEIRRESVDIGRLAMACLQERQAQEPQRDVDIHVAEGMLAEGDYSLLRIAVDNLIGNAWKFTRTGRRARIEVGSVETETGPAFFVRDNGIGLDPSKAQDIFAPFQRLNTGDEFAGTGVGLSIVSRVIGRHGGRVWVEGEPGKGTSFFFTLPSTSGVEVRDGMAARRKDGRVDTMVPGEAARQEGARDSSPP